MIKPFHFFQNPLTVVPYPVHCDLTITIQVY